MFFKPIDYEPVSATKTFGHSVYNVPSVPRNISFGDLAKKFFRRFDYEPVEAAKTTWILQCFCFRFNKLFHVKELSNLPFSLRFSRGYRAIKFLKRFDYEPVEPAGGLASNNWPPSFWRPFNSNRKCFTSGCNRLLRSVSNQLLFSCIHSSYCADDCSVPVTSHV